MKYKILVFVMLFVFCVSYTCEGETMKLKSPTAAMYWSLGSMILPSLPLAISSSVSSDVMMPTGIGLCVTGVIVGPSVGHFYAGNYMRGFASMGLRAGIAGAGILGIAKFYTTEYDKEMEAAIICTAIAGVACIGILASGIYDIWTCPNSVEEYNKSIQKYGGFYLAPRINLIDESYGLTLGYSF